jgi:pSer/pThr/pTyr-binding forkhead associated (FHA) protein
LKSPLIFRVFKNNQLHEVKQFETEQIVIGNNPEANINLQDDSIAAIHALVEFRDQGFFICDLGSASGTLKNGMPVLDEPIQSGDEIQVGPFRILFYVGIPKPQTKPLVVPKGSVQTPPPPPAAKVQGPPPSAPATPSPSVVETKPSASVVTEQDSGSNAQNKSADPSRPHLPSAKEVSELERKEIKSSVPVKPKIAAGTAALHKVSKSGPTFAPPSHVKDAKDFLRPGKGNSIQVVVCWHERILTTYQVKLGQDGIVGQREGELHLPDVFASAGFRLIETSPAVKINVPPGIQAELITADSARFLPDPSIKIQQSEMVKLSGPKSPIEVFVRFAPASRESLFVPPFFLSSGELSGLLASVILALVFAFYISATAPRDLNLQEDEDLTRTAQIIFNEPNVKPKPPEPAPPTPSPEVPPPPPKEVPPPPPEKPKVKEGEESKVAQNKGQATQSQKAQSASRAAEVAPIPNSQNRPKKFTAAETGGSVKIGEKAGANAQSAQKDVSKIGLFSALSTGGIRNKLDQAYTGSGEALGDADKATGTSGMAEDREGDDLGSRFKVVGQGGKGVSTQGIADIGVKGRSTGQSVGGTGVGIGERDAVRVEAGGQEESFVGTINKEHVRRVVRAGIPEMRGCYDRITSRMSSAQRRQFVGKVVLTWDIVARGKAQNVRVKSSTIDNSELENCIRNRLATWTFPEPPGDLTAEVSYPFVFKPAE